MGVVRAGSDCGHRVRDEGFMLNTMFGMFDYLSDKNEVYKVETVKDSFVGVSGAPEKVRKGVQCIIDLI